MKDNYAFRSSTFMRALLVLLFMAVSIQWGFAQLNLNVSRGTLGTVKGDKTKCDKLSYSA